MCDAAVRCDQEYKRWRSINPEPRWNCCRCLSLTTPQSRLIPPRFSLGVMCNCCCLMFVCVLLYFAFMSVYECVPFQPHLSSPSFLFSCVCYHHHRAHPGTNAFRLATGLSFTFHILCTPATVDAILSLIYIFFINLFSPLKVFYSSFPLDRQQFVSICNQILIPSVSPLRWLLTE